MGYLPGWLLRHRITIEPYLGRWGQYSAPQPDVPCQIQYSGGGSTPAGSVHDVTHTVTAQLGTMCPPGSRVTLPDGSRGYVATRAEHSAPGLPTPDHVQFTVVVGAQAGPALGGEQVVILRRVLAGKDRYGNDRYATEETVVGTAAVRMLSSVEQGPSATGSGRTQTVDAVEVLLPPDTEITGQDRMRIRGLVYDVDGTPNVQHDPQTGVDPGVRVIGKRVTG